MSKSRALHTKLGDGLVFFRQSGDIPFPHFRSSFPVIHTPLNEGSVT